MYPYYTTAGLVSLTLRWHKMPTVDITAPAGAFTPAAVGDGKYLITTWTIANGSTSLTCNGASPFVSGDTGKSFSLDGAGSSGGTLGGTLTFVSSNQVTLSVAASTALSASSQLFIWGTDDSPAFQACNVWAQAQTSPITVNLGSSAHTFSLFTVDFPRVNSLVYNCTQPVTVVGQGSASTKIVGPISLGMLVDFTTGNNIYIQPAKAGDTQIILKTLSDASALINNAHILVLGLDMQRFGQPPNNYWSEFALITNINAGTGVITLGAPLTYSYLDSWPLFDPQEGGPASIQQMVAAWSNTVTYQGISMGASGGGQTYCKLYSANFIDVVWIDSGGLTPTQNHIFQATNCDLSSYTMEYDKDLDTCIFDNTKTGQVFLQSSCNRLIIRNGSNISGGLNTNTKFVEVHDSTVNSFWGVGTNSFGRTESFVATNSTFNGGYNQKGVGQIGGADIHTIYTMRPDGVLVIPISTLTYGLQWQIPGARCYFSGQAPPPTNAQIAWGNMFRILSVTGDGTNVYLQTDWQYGGFPTWAQSIINIPSDFVSMDASCTGADQNVANFVSASANGYYHPQTFSGPWTLNNTTCGAPGTGNPISLPSVAGRLISWIVNVTTPYTGVQNPLYWGQQFDKEVIVDSGLNIVPYTPHIDLRTAGQRVIKPSGTTSFGADSGLALPDPKAWFPSFFGNFNASADIRAESGVGPVFTTTMITTQETVALPTLYRMGARV
jgi:hypothetical protein